MDKAKLTDMALFILRIILGIIFVAHGLQKTFGLFGGPGIGGVSSMLGSMGFQPPVLWAWILSVVELAAGLTLIVGVIPRVSALSIAIIMVVAILKVHGAKGFFAMQGGFEYQLLILGACSSIMLAGAGKISLFDKW